MLDVHMYIYTYVCTLSHPVCVCPNISKQLHSDGVVCTITLVPTYVLARSVAPCIKYTGTRFLWHHARCTGTGFLWHYVRCTGTRLL